MSCLSGNAPMCSRFLTLTGEKADEQQLRAAEVFRSLTDPDFSTDTKEVVGSSDVCPCASSDCF